MGLPPLLAGTAQGPGRKRREAPETKRGIGPREAGSCDEQAVGELDGEWGSWWMRWEGGLGEHWERGCVWGRVRGEGRAGRGQGGEGNGGN